MKKFRLFKKLNKKGFTFVECVCAIALFAIIGTMAFSMFTNSTRYMSDAKREEIKQTEAQKMLHEDNFKRIILCPKNLVTTTIGDKLNPINMFYAKLTYATKAGEVTLMVPVSRATELVNKVEKPKKAQTINAVSCIEYVTSDNRSIFIGDGLEQNRYYEDDII